MCKLPLLPIRCVVLPLALLLGACGGHTLRSAEAPHVELIAASFPTTEISAALIRALEKRKFTIENEHDGRLLARFQKGGQSIHVAVEYSTTQFGIRYLDSKGLGERKNEAGTLMVDSHYDDIVGKLDKVIAEELKRPAKERDAAERRAARAAEAQATAVAPEQDSAQTQDDNQAATDDTAQTAQTDQQPTIIENKTMVVQNIRNVRNVRRDVTINNKLEQPASHSGGGHRFCDKAAKAVWSCPSAGAVSACKHNRGSCSAQCTVGGRC